MRKKFKTGAILLASALFALFITALLFYWKPISIRYHKCRINALISAKPKFDPASGLSFFDDEWSMAFEEHRDKLVQLGYLQEKEFSLRTIKTPSLRFRRLWEELQVKFPNNPFTVGLGFESDDYATIVVYDRPQRLREWQKIIFPHDGPATNVIDVPRPEDRRNLLPFVDRWANEQGEVCYIISQAIEGAVKIETPPNELWRTTFRNVRFEGEKILFDEFHYMDPNEDFKFPGNTSGDHPFSGVRCQTVLEVNPNDSNELFTTLTVIGKYGTFADPNKSILKRLR